jgi:hypothetical protein
MAIGISRQTQYQMPHSLRKMVNFNDAGVAAGVLVGTVPAGSIITSVIVQVATAFNAATTNVLTVGTTGTGTDLMTSAEAVAGTQGQKTGAAFKATTASNPVANDQDVFVAYSQTGTAASAGVAYVMVSYHPNNDR